MTNMNDFISDEMLAAYIEGTSTPLENMIIEQQLNDENIREIIELVAESNKSEVLDCVEPVDMFQTIDDFVKPFEEFKELKGEVDKGPGELVL